jgi:enoyl-CoA hydratase/carnithine racemase
LIRVDRRVATRVDRVRDRVTEYVHGACIGAGTEVASFSGQVIAAPDATIRLPELAMSLMPGAGGTVGIARRVGRWRTAWLALSGLPLPLATALRWGVGRRGAK